MFETVFQSQAVSGSISFSDFPGKIRELFPQPGQIGASLADSGYAVRVSIPTGAG